MLRSINFTYDDHAKIATQAKQKVLRQMYEQHYITQFASLKPTSIEHSQADADQATIELAATVYREWKEKKEKLVSTHAFITINPH